MHFLVTTFSENSAINFCGTVQVSAWEVEFELAVFLVMYGQTVVMFVVLEAIPMTSVETAPRIA